MPISLAKGLLPRTWAAASVKPQRALEAVLTDSPNSGNLLFFAFWEMPAMASPSTCRRQKALRHGKCSVCVCVLCVAMDPGSFWHQVSRELLPHHPETQVSTGEKKLQSSAKLPKN